MNNKKNDNTVISAVTRIKITDNDLEDILSTILETDAVSYWIDSAEAIYGVQEEPLYKQLTKNGQIKFRLTEPFERNNYNYILDKNSLLKGIRMYIENKESPYNIIDVPNNCHETELRLDTSNIDSLVADIILQYSLFEEIIFGWTN